MAGLKEEISSTHNKIIELLGQGKNKEALEYYTDDCVIMPPGKETVRGKDAFLKFIEASAELQSKVGKSECVEEVVFGEGDLVTSRSKGTVYGKDDSVIFTEKALTVWKKVNGKYLVHNVVWNMDKPFTF
ncbi:uncharacterized protein LOC114516667 [Dendronephthya gigantea]|uniref:uncharacterized protein LOC114516667 n=1 Tax=Dendronephthya gigantea TaxID=151771 RepID=UPI00106C94CF|nr:uncharacterized protein LOC114516667 [Dendronephthya gigantea]